MGEGWWGSEKVEGGWSEQVEGQIWGWVLVLLLVLVLVLVQHHCQVQGQPAPCGRCLPGL